MSEDFQTGSANAGSTLSPAKRDLLQKYLVAGTQKLASPQRIARRSSEERPRLSFGQERLWFLDQWKPGSPVYNVPIAVWLETTIDASLLEKSLNEIIRRHEVLRTTFTTVDGQPVPVVAPTLDLTLTLIDLTDRPASTREADAQRMANEEAHRPFDLARGPLVRACLLRLDQQKQMFLVTMHHIVSDGWSMVLLFRELTAIYEAFSRGELAPLQELPIQFADYAAWQRDWLQGEVLEKQLAYWRRQLGGTLPIMELPTDRPRPPVQTYDGARELLTLPATVGDELLALSRREGATLFMTLLAAFNVLLYRHAGQEDIIVGSPIASRPRTETEPLIGFFLNNLALRTDLSGNPNFREVLRRVRQTSFDAYAHQDVPFEKLIEDLKPERDLSRTSIFQVYFNLFNFADEIELPGANEQRLSLFDVWTQADEDLSKFDLTLYACVRDQEIKLALVYNTDLFDQLSIRRMLAHFERLLVGVVANPDRSIEDYPLRAAAESAEAANSVRCLNPFIEFDKLEIEQSIPERFERQVRLRPRHLAVKSRNHEWSYQELNHAANRVANSILRRGAGEGRIALLFEHDAPMIAALLGTLKAGTTYVPLDPLSPPDRLAHILRDSQSVALVTNDKNLALAKNVTGTEVALINVDSLDSATADIDPSLRVKPSALAYLLYTSGSTGKPKGVMQTHRNVLHYIRVYTNNLHINADDRMTLLSSYCFDAAVMDIFGSLLNGATLYPIDLRAQGLSGLTEWLSSEQITIYHSTPTVYRYFTKSLKGQNGFPQLRLVVLGGEEVNRSDIELYRQHFSDNCLFVNGLGPTEATVTLQYFTNKQTDFPGQGVPVGFPVEDTEVLLLNAAGRSTEIYGEIAIKSAHVAPGYWRNPEATAASFVLGGPESDRIIYRTGDIGRRLPNGAIQFVRRKDFQVKIRGFRVELGEIESAISDHPEIRENAVLALENDLKEKQLVAYIVPRAERLVTLSDLRKDLQRKLPDYMVPASFVVLEALPRTSSGKLNRSALPAPEETWPESDEATVTPRDELEHQLIKIWEKVLDVKPIGVKDDFFMLGGHSLLAVNLFSQIEKAFGRKLPLATLFQAPTIRHLANVLRLEEWTPPWSSLIAIQPNGSKPTFFSVHGHEGDVLFYTNLVNHLGSDRPFYALQAQGLDGKQPRHTRVEDMAAHYIKEIQAVQPEGPYYLGGYCFGGKVAFEMARQLESLGQTVELLAMFDAYAPGYRDSLPHNLRSVIHDFVRKVSNHVQSLGLLESQDRLTYVQKRARLFGRRLEEGTRRVVARIAPNLVRAQDAKPRFDDYRPGRYSGEVTLFRAKYQPGGGHFDPELGWGQLAEGGVKVHEIPGYFDSILSEPRVRVLAQELRTRFDAQPEERARMPKKIFAPTEAIEEDVTISEEILRQAAVRI